MLMKLCARCGKKIPSNAKCDCVKERHKIYNREYRDNESADFYNSKQWKTLRNICKLKANGLDLYELLVNNKYVKGTLSHHIEELKDNKSRALDINNLIWISDKTHNYIHAQYDKSAEDKKNMQNKLFDILNKYYNNEFILFEMTVGGGN